MPKEAKAKYKQSETVSVMRSEINYAKYNPKQHTKELVKEIKENIENVAFLGGIVWNSTTGNLIDGHKRIMSLDLIHRYKGDEKTDYPIKVEKIELDSKTEKEQNVFQTRSRTELDLQIVQTFYNEIDPAAAGLNSNDISFLTPVEFPIGETDDMLDIFERKNSKVSESESLDMEVEEIGATDEEKKQAMKDVKAGIKEGAIRKAEDNLMSYLTLNFPDFKSKREFMERCNLDPYQTFIDGVEFGEMVEVMM